MFIFVVSKHKFYRKTVSFRGIQTRIVGVEGKLADHLTITNTTFVRLRLSSKSNKHDDDHTKLNQCHTGQCDQMAKLLVQYLAIYNSEN